MAEQTGKLKKLRWANPLVRQFATLLNDKFQELHDVMPEETGETGVKATVLIAARIVEKDFRA